MTIRHVQKSIATGANEAADGRIAGVPAERIAIASDALSQISQIFYGLIDLSDRNMRSDLQQIDPALMKAIALRGRDLSVAAEDLLKNEDADAPRLGEQVAGLSPIDVLMIGTERRAAS